MCKKLLIGVLAASMALTAAIGFSFLSEYFFIRLNPLLSK